jgi:molybdopterin-guanine dinucleotide biosynthesis protein A
MQFSAALLAGGRSSRMGRDKAFLEIDGIPLWQRQLRILQELHPAKLFVAGPPRPEWIDAGLDIVPDAAADAGPLAGLVAVLRCCTTASLLVLAIDLPNMTSDFLKQLVKSGPGGAGVIPKIGDRFEPLAAVYPASCLPLAETLLATPSIPEARSLQKLIRHAVEQGLMMERQISRNEERFFFNLNTPKDLDFARTAYAPQRRSGHSERSEEPHKTSRVNREVVRLRSG